MSRLGARIKRRKSEEKIRSALSDPRIQAHIQEWIAPKPEPLPRRYVETIETTRSTRGRDPDVERVYLAALTIAIALGLSWAVWSFIASEPVVRVLVTGGAS